MYEYEEKHNAYGHICESVHDKAAIVNSPVNIKDNRIMNPDQRVMNPVVINLHIHINELPEGTKTKGFIAKIIGGLYNAINKPRHKTIENLDGISTEDIQRLLVRGNKN